MIQIKAPTNSELERASNYFKIYKNEFAPSITAKQPIIGETWNLSRTFPSGVGIGSVDPENSKGLFREIVDNLFGIKRPKPSKSDRDVRSYQYDIKKLDGNPYLPYLGNWDTKLVSWHPSKQLMVTAGYRGNVKLWQISNGKLLTPIPWQSTYASGSNIVWMNKGLVFKIDENCICSGETGDKIIDEYSIKEYEGCSPLYFSSIDWRPNSKSEFAISDGSKVNLIDSSTKDIKYSLDFKFDLIDKLKWHPGGRYLAVLIENSGIKIVDMDDHLLIDAIAGKDLVGWSPNGRYLVAKDGEIGIIVWDSISMQENSSVDFENEIWFKKLVKDIEISADELRYLELQYGVVNLYSTNSNEHLAQLKLESKYINSANWSPINGSHIATSANSESQIWTLA